MYFLSFLQGKCDIFKVAQDDSRSFNLSYKYRGFSIQTRMIKRGEIISYSVQVRRIFSYERKSFVNFRMKNSILVNPSDLI